MILSNFLHASVDTDIPPPLHQNEGAGGPCWCGSCISGCGDKERVETRHLLLCARVVHQEFDQCLHLTCRLVCTVSVGAHQTACHAYGYWSLLVDQVSLYMQSKLRFFFVAMVEEYSGTRRDLACVFSEHYMGRTRFLLASVWQYFCLVSRLIMSDTIKNKKTEFNTEKSGRRLVEIRITA